MDLLEQVGGALQEVLSDLGGCMADAVRDTRTLAVHRALALVRRYRQEENPSIGRALWKRGSRADCIGAGAELEQSQGVTSWVVAPLNEEAGRWGLFV